MPKEHTAASKESESRQETVTPRAEHLVTLSEPRSPVSEAYRALRTNLEFSSLERPLRTLLVTSPGPEEGKSTILANLAVILAQADKKVILVDGDLRRPSLHEFFGLSNGRGLTNVLTEEKARQRPPLQQTSVPNLLLLPSGPTPPNPAELLASPRTEQIIARLSERADLLLFDAPPVVAVTDAAVLAAKLDGVLLVIRAGRTKREQAQRAVALLEKVNARLVGAVLSNVQLDRSMEYYGA